MEKLSSNSPEPVQVAIPVIILASELPTLDISARHERWLEEMISVCSVLEITVETAIWYAELRGQLNEAGTPIPSDDVWIAALCRQHTLAILSRDRHFDFVKGLRRLDW